MTSTRYTILGWLIWQIGSRVARRKVARNRVKLGAVGVVAAAAVAGVVIARAGRNPED